MATLKIESADGPTVFTLTDAVSTTDLARFYDALRVQYGAGLSDADAFATWARAIFGQAVGITADIESGEAASAAAAAYIPIELTEV